MAIDDILGQGIGNALSQGAQAGYYTAQAGRESNAEKRRIAAEPHIAAAVAGDPSAMGEVARLDPKTANLLSEMKQRNDHTRLASVKAAADFSSQAANAVLSAPPDQRAAIYSQFLEQGKREGHDLSGMPSAYNPAVDSNLRFQRDKAVPVTEWFKAQQNELQPMGPGTGGGGAPTGGGLPGAWDPHFDSASKATGLPVQLIRAVAQTESGGNPNAVSPAGATGPMQFMPGTARDMGVTNPRDPAQAIPAGAAYLKQQMDKYGGNPTLGLMAYNWGPGNVDNWLKGGADPSKVPQETRDYVLKVQGQSYQPAGGQPSQGQPSQGQAPQSAAPGGEQIPGLKLPSGTTLLGKHGVPMMQNGYVAIQHADGSRGWLAMPPKKEQGGPFAGNGMEQQATNILLTGDPASPEYAAAYAHMAAPRTTVDPATGQAVTIQPNVSHFRPPGQAQAAPQQGMPVFAPPGATPGIVPAGGMPAAPQNPSQQPPAAITQAPGGQTVTVTPGRGKEIPTAEVEKIQTNLSALKQIDRTLEELKRAPGSIGGPGSIAASILPGVGNIQNRIDTEGTNLRALISDIGSLKIHDRSGAAVTAAESPRLRPFIPTMADDPETARKKLIQFRNVYEQVLQDYSTHYSAQGGFREYAPLNQYAPPAIEAPKSGAETARDKFNADKAASGAPQTSLKMPVIQPKSEQEYNALPSGAQYMHPDGQTKVKP